MTETELPQNTENKKLKKELRYQRGNRITRVFAIGILFVISAIALGAAAITGWEHGMIFALIILSSCLPALIVIRMDTDAIERCRLCQKK